MGGKITVFIRVVQDGQFDAETNCNQREDVLTMTVDPQQKEVEWSSGGGGIICEAEGYVLKRLSMNMQTLRIRGTKAPAPIDVTRKGKYGQDEEVGRLGDEQLPLPEVTVRAEPPGNGGASTDVDGNSIPF